MSSLEMFIAMFRLHTASLHQAMRSTGCVKPYKVLCYAAIGWFSTAVIGSCVHLPVLLSITYKFVKHNVQLSSLLILTIQL